MTDRTVSVGCLRADKPDEQMQSGGSEASGFSILYNGNDYFISEGIGEGGFGKVVKAVNVCTSQDVSLKILKHGAQREMRMLEAMSALDPAKYNVVHFMEQFQDYGQTCLVFERLDMNLYQLLQQRHGHPLTLNEIRPIAHQLLTAFEALKSIGLVHSDLKPDNVMLVNHEREPFRVKLINFGRSFMTSENTRCNTHTQGYSSPEVILGLPVSEAIDMWGLGCVLLFLYLANHPFSVNCRYQGMKGIVDMLGQPDDNFLNAGKYTSHFFVFDKQWRDLAWSIKTPSEFKRGTGIQAKEWVGDIRSLDELITLHPLLNGSNEIQDRREFISLLKGLLQIDSKRRLTPQRGLSHPFISMVNMMDDIECPYLMNCLDKMRVLYLDDDDEDFCSAVPQSEDTGSAASHSSGKVEDLDSPREETADMDAAEESPEER